MDICMNEITSTPPPLPNPHLTDEASQPTAISDSIPPNPEQIKCKMSRKKWIYTLCFIAFATIATVSLSFGISAYQSNEVDRFQTSKLQNFTSQVQAAKIKVRDPNLLTNVNARVPRFVQKNCYELKRKGIQISCVYNIIVRKKITKVYCDLETDGGGWTVIQRRISNATDFYRGWTSYVVGFGDLFGNFWLGLENIHAITSSQSYQLRVDLEDFSGNRAYALYRSFSIGNESSNYRLNYYGYSGNARNSLRWHNNKPFTTNDRDNDDWDINCAVARHGAWWYGGLYGCAYSNLNGKYYSSGVDDLKGVFWFHWKYNYESLKRVEMKIKPN